MTAKTLKDPLNSSGIEPLGNRILIQPDLMDEYSEGGIYIREQDREVHDSSASSQTIGHALGKASPAAKRWCLPGPYLCKQAWLKLL